MNAYVYLAKAGELYKIGTTVDLAERMSQLARVHRGLKCLWLLTIKYQMHGYWLEQALHRFFAKGAIGREWFILTDADIEKFKSLTPDDLPEIGFKFRHVGTLPAAAPATDGKEQ